ncbi:sensor domain-containing protein [Micromonospora sp. NPDC049559]|uniref:sensor histidine kinase n=1 Tax=Micromonospora sp. NPDC049559 TaxID=3155923 RepID=UPI0034177FA0
MRNPGTRTWLALGRCHLLSWLAVAETAVWSVAALAVLGLPVGLGFVLLAPAATGLRALSNRSRRWLGTWSGRPVGGPDALPARTLGRSRRVFAILSDEGFWRDLVWATVDPVVGGLLVAVPVCLVWFGAFGALVQPFVWQHLGPDNWYAFVPVGSTPTALVAAALGLVFVLVGVLLAPPILRLHERWSRLVLSPPRHAELARRVARLTDTRADAVDAQAAELRRIERDLHDGAQARLVAMGMTLDNATRLLDRDPEAARQLLLDARDTSTRALDDLRDLVRGIHPPVLADRGLGDAVRSLALDSFLDVDVEVHLGGRPPTPVESAAYFAINELLTNAAKHAGARTVRVILDHDGRTLRATVSDDGHGGADPARGTGLRGIRRRLGTFDGTLAVHSPPGGPTTVTMEIPCALSSPKTSSSSGTD